MTGTTLQAYPSFPALSSDSDLAAIDEGWQSRCGALFGDAQFLGQLRKISPSYLARRNFPYLGSELSLRVFINTDVARDWYDKDVNYSELQQFVRHGCQLVGPGDTVFDCGAHHGVYSMVFADAVGPAGHVLAFEPVPLNAQLARLNADINGYRNIDVYPLGVGARDETIVAAMQAHSTSPSVDRSSGDSVTMEIVALDRFADRRPAFVKLDVEGAEVDALMGATELIRTRPKVLISVHPPFMTGFGRQPQEIFSYLPASHFDCLILYPGRPIERYSESIVMDTFCELLFLPR